MDVVREKLHQNVRVEGEHNMGGKCEIVHNVSHNGELGKLPGVELGKNELILVENRLVDIPIGPLNKENKTRTNVKK